MNTTMTNQINQRVTDAINIALEETRRDAIQDCEAVIWKQYYQYEKLLESPEAWEIYMGSNGERFLKLIETRRSLRSKMELLSTIAGKIFDAKWEK